MKVLVENQEILIVKSLFCGFNTILTKLVTDPKFDGILELFEGCTVESFLALEKYYGCGMVEINEENCVDILSICVYYDEKLLFNECQKYIVKHYTDEIISKILNRIELFHYELISDLHQITNNYLQLHSLELLQKDVITKLSIESLKFILQSQSICIRNETELFKSLIYYYNFKVYESELNDKNELQKIFEFISYKNVDFDSLNEDENEVINSIPILSILLQNFHLNHVVIPIPENINKILYPIILKYYINKDEKPLFCIDNEDIKLIQGNDISESIEMLLNTNDIKIIIITLLIIIDGEIQYKELNNTSSVLYKNIFSKLLSEYHNNSNDSLKHFTCSIPKCLTLFINNQSSIETTNFVCGRKLLYEILNCFQCISDLQLHLIIKYLKQYRYSCNNNEKERQIIENEDKEYFDMLENNEMKNIFLDFLATFTYPNNNYYYFANEQISIKPICDGKYCSFIINPKLPDGMIFNSHTGEISGIINKPIRQKYTIVCENITNKISCKIKLEIYEDIKFTEYLKSNKNKLLLERSIQSNGKEEGEYYLLNIIMDEYIYHIKYRISGINKESSFQIGATNSNHFPKDSYEDKTACCFSFHSGLFYLYGANGTPIKSPSVNYTDNSTYECIFNMKTKQFILKYENGMEEVLWEKIQGPLYPFVLLVNETTIDLVGFWKE